MSGLVKSTIYLFDEATGKRHDVFFKDNPHSSLFYRRKKTARFNERPCQIDNVISLMRESAMINLLLCVLLARTLGGS